MSTFDIRPMTCICGVAPIASAAYGLCTACLETVDRDRKTWVYIAAPRMSTNLTCWSCNGPVTPIASTDGRRWHICQLCRFQDFDRGKGGE